MRNNKNITFSDMEIGMKVKVALPTSYAHWQKDRMKQLSWFKGKILDKYEGGTFTVMIYPRHWLGRMQVLAGDEYRIVKCL